MAQFKITDFWRLGALGSLQSDAPNAGFVSRIVARLSALEQTLRRLHLWVESGRIVESSGPTALEIGAIANGQYLVRTGTSVVGAAGPSAATWARVTKTAAQTTTNGVAAELSWDAETEDLSGMHDNVTNNGRLTVPAGAAGLYLVLLEVDFAASAAGDRNAQIYKNGSGGTLIAQASVRATGGGGATVPVSGLCRLAVGDYVNAYATQSSGGNLNVNTTASWFGAVFQST